MFESLGHNVITDENKDDCAIVTAQLLGPGLAKALISLSVVPLVTDSAWLWGRGLPWFSW